jgi:HSP20 family protein
VTGRRRAHESPDFPGTPNAQVGRRPAFHAPPVDVVAEAGGWRLVFEVPGAIPSTLSVEIRHRTLVLRGEQRPTDGEQGRFLRIERAAGPFERILELPEDPDPDAAKATYADGLLTLLVPRLETPPRNRTIPVRRRT